ncbi:hypothetical protein [Melittangium boletus]|uniref:hypothetical protein n=1 Tax=Melittangium boletus TaxID=83453 RepID=UPI003DA34DCE
MRTLIAGLVSAALLLDATSARACGPTHSMPLFVFPKHPDRPFSAFAATRFGILLPTYRPLYLLYAYRTLSGVPTTREEQRTLAQGLAREQDDERLSVEDALAEWHSVRNALLSEAPSAAPRLTETSNYAEVNRLQVHALSRAATTARTLSRLWKAHPAVTREWVRAQDRVFGPCEEPQGLPALEEALNEGLSAAERARRLQERAYQDAARLFYCGGVEEAVTAFQVIAAEPTSPHRAWGNYLAARAIVRQVLQEREDFAALTPEQRARFTRADALLVQVLADAAQRETHAPARRLLGLIRIRMDREARRCELYARVLEEGTGTALESELVDLNLLYFKGVEDCPGLTGAAADLQLWMRTVSEDVEPPADAEQEARKAYATALAKWKKGARPAWLVAALMKARPDSPELSALLAAAVQVPLDSPAGLTVAWYTTHLLRHSGQVEAAREHLARLTPAMTDGLPSAENLVRRERLALARSWEEVFREAPRQQTGLSELGLEDRYTGPRTLLFDDEALTVLGPGLQARRLRELARAEHLSPPMQRQARWAAFARAAVVGEDDTLRAVARELAGMEPAASAELLRLAERPTAEERLFDARLLLMGLPVVSPFLHPTGDRDWAAKSSLTEDVSHVRNWWCVSPEWKELAVPFSFLTPDEAQAARAEWRSLVEAGPAVRWFGRVAVDWAQAHPEDPRSPEALYRVVRASKRGCGGQNTKEAMAAFRLLHQRYGKSEWARRVPVVH